MSKLSFRARALDASKSLPVYRGDEIPDIPEFTAINRAVPQMPTGMEKEEESEHHLQRALSAQQVYGTAEALIIPVPDIVDVEERYKKLYYLPKEYKPPRQYVHVQPWGMDMDIPDYDMDSEDDTWLEKQIKKMDISHLKFEKMMDRLEKGSGQTVVTLPEAKALLREDDDLTIAIYDYWLNKRLRLQHALIPSVKTERRDGSTSNNPYVAFRRRTEKMQTRKNRKNDEISYERMLKLRRDLNRVLTILELMKRREKSKKEVLQLSIEIVDKRYQMEDWNSVAFSEALALRHKLPSLLPLPNAYDWQRREQQQMNQIPQHTYERQRKPKREYKKRKHSKMFRLQNEHSSTTPSTSITSILPIQPASIPSASSLYNDIDIMANIYSSEEEMPTPANAQVVPEPEPEIEEPDGNFTFKRKAGCKYYSATSHVQVRDDPPDLRHRYQLLSLRSNRCIGYSRRRMGRGGRVWFDRMQSSNDEPLNNLHKDTSQTRLFRDYIVNNKIPHFTASKRQSIKQPDQIPTNSLSNKTLSNEDIDEQQNKYRPVLITTNKVQPYKQTNKTARPNVTAIRSSALKDKCTQRLEGIVRAPVKESALYNALVSTPTSCVSSLLTSKNSSCPVSTHSNSSVAQLAMAPPSKSLKKCNLLVPQSVYSH